MLTLRWHHPSAPPDPDAGGVTVLVTGVFDLLHVGHLRFLRSARAAGERLLVGVEDDLRTAQRKGADRPVVPLSERCELLAALEPVDGVFAISGSADESALAPAYARLLQPLKPSVLAFTEGDGAEIGRRLVAEWLGCSVAVAPRTEGRSTTLLLSRMLQARARTLDPRQGAPVAGAPAEVEVEVEVEVERR